MRKHKALAIFLTVFMMLTLMPAMAFADTTKVSDTQIDNKKNTDVTGHWASQEISKWSGAGVIKGDGNGFRPNDPITRAEMAVILNNLMGYQKKANNLFIDVDNGAWYADSILKANAAGILNGDGTGHANPNANITREQAVVMLARAFGVDNSSANKTLFKDSGEISLWAQPLVFGMEANQYIGGKGNGYFESKANITRAEVVKIIDNSVKEYYTTSGTYTANVSPTNHGANCLAIVKADGVMIKGAKITGDLIIAEGVGNGNVTLDGATITGKLLARGGGKNSIHIINGAQVNGRVSVERVDGTVRIVSNGVTISTLEADTEVILEGSFTNVVIAEGAAVQVKGQVKNISVAAKALLTITKDATVDTIAVEKGAIGAKVDVSGTVNTVKTDAPKTEIKVTETAKVTKVEAATTATGTNVSLDKSAEVKTLNSDSTITTSGEGTPKAITGNGKVTNSGTPASSSGGGGGGGGSTGSGGDSGASTGGSTGDGGGGNTVPTPTVLVESVTLNKKAINIEAGKAELLVATVLPVNATNKTVTWSSDNEKVATVDRNGLVRAIKEGTSVITVTTADGSKTASCTITVTEKYDLISPETKVYVNEIEVISDFGFYQCKGTLFTPVRNIAETLNIRVSYNAEKNQITFSSGENTLVMTIGSKRAELNGKEVSLQFAPPIIDNRTFVPAQFVVEAFGGKLKVIEQNEDSVRLNKKTASIEVGKTELLVATVFPVNATNKTVTWSSDNKEVATVDSSGLVSAIKAGTAVITATTADGSKTASCTITVTEKYDLISPETKVYVNEIEVIPDVGFYQCKGTLFTPVRNIAETLNIRVSYNAEKNQIIFSSGENTLVMTIGSIRAELNGKEVSLQFAPTIIDSRTFVPAQFVVEAFGGKLKVVQHSDGNQKNVIDPENITITKSITVEKNDVLTITPILTPKNSYAPIRWESSDDSIAKVDGAGGDTSGNVTGISAGKATITAYTNNGLLAACEVTVLDTPEVLSISMDDSLKIKRGFQNDLEITLSPYHAKTLYSAESSNPDIVEVSLTGGRTGVRVTGISPGKAQVTIRTDNGLSATCNVTVLEAPDPTNISIPSSYKMNGGESWDIPINLSPNDCGTAFRITSSDSTVARVFNIGGRIGCRVTAYSSGTAVVTVYTENGLSASCIITVINE